MRDKRVTATISEDTWKSLKIIALQKSLSLQDVIKDVLERSMSKHMKKMNVAAEIEE